MARLFIFAGTQPKNVSAVFVTVDRASPWRSALRFEDLCL
jgi:hypothetical protein